MVQEGSWVVQPTTFVADWTSTWKTHSHLRRQFSDLVSLRGENRFGMIVSQMVYKVLLCRIVVTRLADGTLPVIYHAVANLNMFYPLLLVVKDFYGLRALLK